MVWLQEDMRQSLHARWIQIEDKTEDKIFTGHAMVQGIDDASRKRIAG